MTLSPLDDYPVHQIADVVAHVGTSDRNFYDRYYFNAHDRTGEVFLLCGLGQYPNLGVTDAFATVVHGGRQRVVRASRELGGDRSDTSVGPLRVEVLEGLRRLRIRCGPNEWGISFDLTWDAAVPAVLEPRMFMRQLGRVIFDTTRLTQAGRWSGSLTVAGERFEVTPERWWGARDHSWGIRPVGEPEPPGIRVRLGLEGFGFFWNWAVMQFDDRTLLYVAQEDRAGTRVCEEAVRIRPDGAPEDLGPPRHEIALESGTRRLKGATIAMGAEGAVSVEPLATAYMFGGTGYGGDANWGHGMYQGPLKVQGLEWDLTDPGVLSRISGLNDSLCRFEADDRVGYGVFELGIFGSYLPYGFESPADMAP